MTKEEKEVVLHCLRSMIDEELCEECPLWGSTGTDHCEEDCVRLAIKELEQEPCDKCVYSTSEGCQYDDITETIPPFETSDDAISRQVAKKALEDRFMELQKRHDDKRYETNYCLNTILELPSVTSQKPICPSAGIDCEDCPAYEDTISRQAAIDAIYARYIGGKEAVDKAPANDQYAEGIDEAVCAVEDLPSVTPRQKWIPVSKRLPEDFGTYLITLEGGDVCKCEFNPDFIDEEHENGAFTYYHEYFDPATLGLIDGEEEAVDAIAWMPFEPYKAEGSETE